MILLILVCSIFIMYTLLNNHLLHIMRYIIAIEAVLFIIIFFVESWNSSVSWRLKGQMILCLLPLIGLLIVLFPFLGSAYVQVPSQDPTVKVLNVISNYWEAGWGCVLLCCVTVFALKVQKFYHEVVNIKSVDIPKPAPQVPRRRRVVYFAEEGSYGQEES
ncbi:hypothetical protein KSZ_18080 [Dictyobacter formicarum]|uniref:Uncharacterized protein n=1 Tax=Dictyobacter formicarum TaxID=2778368 RepID=A0ABQ3VCC3_9CHLR|nr:hypothetical protein KSZ_18080 [Dictyobacter formicarum]